MYAIVEIAGLQYKVQQKQRVFVNRLDAKEGDSIEFGNVLLIDNDGKIQVGSPLIDGARVAAKVISHLQGDKVIVFKKKRRKGYQKSNGHRQKLSEVLVQGILGKGEKLSAEDAKIDKKPRAAKVEKVETEVEEVAPKKAAAKKAAAPKKAAPKKAAPKKAAPKKAAK